MRIEKTRIRGRAWLCPGFVWWVVMVMGFCGGCADKMILFPSTEPVDAQGAERRELVREDGRVVEVWVARSPGARRSGRVDAYLLEFTGNASRAEDVAAYVAERLAGRAVEAWAVNYPGYGGSTGPARLKEIPGAALLAFDEVEKVAAGRPIVVGGNSLGSTAALWVAAERGDRVTGVVLQNPPPLRQLIMGRFGWWNLWIGAGIVAAGVPSELDSVRNAKRVRVPGVFVLAGSDELVWPKYQRMVAEAFAGEKRVVEVGGGTHNSELDEEATRGVVEGVGWILGAAR